jgi:hypothetical protein
MSPAGAFLKIVWRELFGQTNAHTDTKTVIIFAKVCFLGVPHPI